MARLYIDLSGSGGLVDNYHGDRAYSTSKPELRILAEDTQYADGFVNPFTKYGYISPSNNTTEATTISLSGLPHASLTTPYIGTPYAYLAESEVQVAKLHLMDELNKTTSSTANLFDAGSSNTTNIIDMEYYYRNGNRKIFYLLSTTNIASPASVGILTPNGTLVDGDWIYTAPAGAFTPSTRATRLILADNTFLYLLDGARIHKIDGNDTGGTNGTVYENVLSFLGTVSGTRDDITSIQDGMDYRSKMWLALNIYRTYPSLTNPIADKNYTDYVAVYVWDRQTTTINATDLIKVEGARDALYIFEFQGTPFMFTLSNDGYTELRQFTGSRFQVVKKLGRNARPAYRDSISTTTNVLTWLGKDGILYGYGNIEGGGNSLHKLADVTGFVASGKTFNASGAILFSNEKETNTSGYNDTPEGYYLTFDDTEGTVYCKRYYPYAYEVATTSQYPQAGNMYTPVKLLPKLSDIKGITIFYPKIGSGGTDTVLTVKIYYNQSTTPTHTVTFDEDDAQRGYKYIQSGTRHINSLQIEFEWDTAIPLKDTITPSYALVDYDETTQKQ